MTWVLWKIHGPTETRRYVPTSLMFTQWALSEWQVESCHCPFTLSPKTWPRQFANPNETVGPFQHAPVNWICSVLLTVILAWISFQAKMCSCAGAVPCWGQENQSPKKPISMVIDPGSGTYVASLMSRQCELGSLCPLYPKHGYRLVELPGYMFSLLPSAPAPSRSHSLL